MLQPITFEKGISSEVRCDSYQQVRRGKLHLLRRKRGACQSNRSTFQKRKVAYITLEKEHQSNVTRVNSSKRKGHILEIKTCSYHTCKGNSSHAGVNGMEFIRKGKDTHE